MPVDTSLTINGYAVTSKPKDPKVLKFEPWSYHPRPLGDNDVEVKIDYCGICGSDIHTASGGWGDIQYPIIVGHEIVGHITAKGKNVTQFNVGDRVACGAQCGCCHQCDICKQGDEQHCPGMIGTYNGKYPDGERSQGGYASHKRFDSHFCFKLPDNLPSAAAAPLLCAGVTTFAPLKRYQAGPGKKVGVIGIGGLGHLAIQWAAKMGADVVAISTSASKQELAKQLGAKDYINISDDNSVNKHLRSFDLVVCTANGKDMNYDKYISLCKLDANFVLLAAPEDQLKLTPFSLILGRVHVVGSLIGSKAEIEEMLAFASKHNVLPWIELLPISQVNEGIRKVQQNDVKFRVVLEYGK